MKKTLLTFVILTLLTQPIYSQTNITKKQWQADLEYLKNLIDQQYPHLYYRISQEDFHKSVDEVRKEIPRMDRHEIIVSFARLIAQFKIGHTAMPLFLAMHGETLNTDFHTLPVYFYQYSDGLYIQATTEDYNEVAGAKVLKIGNMATEKAIEAIRPVVSAENDSYFKAYGIPYLSCPEVLHAQGVIADMGTVQLLLEKDGKTFTKNLPGYEKHHTPAWYGTVTNGHGWVSGMKVEATPLRLKAMDQPFHFEHLEAEKTVYIRQSQIQNGENESIAHFYNRVLGMVEHAPVEKLILDLRQNGGGNNYLNKPIITGLVKSKINEKGKLIVLIGRRTFSAAQNLVNELEYYTNAIFIGEPTAENVNFWGDANKEMLPNCKLPFQLSFMWWQDKDPRDKRLATTPHIAMELSWDDFYNGKDPVLEMALAYENRVPETIAEIKQQVLKDKPDLAEKVGRKFINNQQNSHQKGELRVAINALGYEYINTNQKLAIEVFKLNTRLFPDNANGWDSLAEAYLNASDYAKAVEYYKRAIEIDPNGATGTHAREMLEQMRQHGGG